MLKKQTLICSLVALAACREIVKAPSTQLDPQVVTSTAPAPTGADPELSNQWALAKVGLSGSALAAPAYEGNPNVRVAVLSSGVDYNHPELQGRVAINATELAAPAPGSSPQNGLDDDHNGLVDDIVGFDVLDNDGYAFDRAGAGTALAGIIAANANNGVGIRGIAPKTTIVPVRWFHPGLQDGAATVTGQTLISALKAASTLRANIVLLELPATVTIADPIYELYYPEYYAAILAAFNADLAAAMTKLASENVPVVIGAGSTLSLAPGDNKLLGLLMSFKNVLIVTSSTQTDEKSFPANSGPGTVHTSAPGEEVLTLGTNGRLQTVSSTAAAAAHVAGALALVAAQKGNLAASTHLQKLISSAASDTPSGLVASTIGRNRLNVVKLLSAY